MSGQHADGPWEYMPDVDMVVAPASWQDGEGYHMDLRFPRIIATLADDWDQKHNGLLIAAAPELLDAGESLMELLGPWEIASPNPEMRKAIAAMREAIAKVKGTEA